MSDQMTESGVSKSVHSAIMDARRFIDENVEDMGRDVLRRTLHRMLDGIVEACRYEACESNARFVKQGAVMAETARRNVRVERENAELLAFNRELVQTNAKIINEDLELRACLREAVEYRCSKCGVNWVENLREKYCNEDECKFYKWRKLAQMEVKHENT